MSPSQHVTIADDENPTIPLTQLSKPDPPRVNAPRFGKRHVQVLFYGIFYAMVAAVNSCMPICLVAMTDSTSSINKNIPTYEWTKKGTVIPIFLWGNMTTQILGGWLSSRYGGKWILVITNGICSILVLLLPTVIYTLDFEGLLISRFLQGALTGFTGTSIVSLLAKWAPPQERSILAIIAGSGLTGGSVVIMFASGYIAASWHGWPMVFYAVGSTQLLSSLLFAYFGYNSPENHPTISEQEVIHIINCSIVEKDKKILSTPWTQILTSTSFMALVLVQCTYTLGIYVLVSETPIYFSKFMKLDIKSNSNLSTLPILIMWFLGYMFSFLSDWLISKKMLTVGKTRKLLISIGFLVPSVGLLLLANCDKNDITMATILMVVGIGFSNATMTGYMVNHIDLSPNHAGTLMGIASQLALLCSGAGVLLVQYVVTDETDPSQWKIVFYSTAVVFAFSAIIFDIFGSGKVQHWND